MIKRLRVSGRHRGYGVCRPAGVEREPTADQILLRDEENGPLLPGPHGHQRTAALLLAFPVFDLDEDKRGSVCFRFSGDQIDLADTRAEIPFENQKTARREIGGGF